MSGSHRSIGEVLALLSAEHPDLTISKIRFLENQGLISPQRTSSGYRKFFDADIEQLDWILTQQRDHFLPLKEIKRRLARGAVTSRAARGVESLPSRGATPSLFAGRSGGDDAGEADAAASAETGGGGEAAAIDLSRGLTAEQLADALGADVTFVSEIRRMGIIEPLSAGAAASSDAAVFDEDALHTARTAAAFVARGLPARALRMFKVAADREAGTYEQLLAVLKARGDAGRLHTELEELTDLAETLRRQLLRRTLAPLLA